MDRRCKKYANRSCYICGRFPDCQAKVKDFLKKAYQAYSGIILGNNHKPSAPHICCKTCIKNLREWRNKERKNMAFDIQWCGRKGMITLATATFARQI